MEKLAKVWEKLLPWFTMFLNVVAIGSFTSTAYGSYLYGFSGPTWNLIFLILYSIFNWWLIWTYAKKLRTYESAPIFIWASRTSGPLRFTDSRFIHNYGTLSIQHSRGIKVTNCAIYLNDLQTEDGETAGFIPFPLKWAGYEQKDREVKLDIRDGETRQVHFCAWPGLEPELEKDTKRAFTGIRFIPALHIHGRFVYPSGTYMATLLLSADNCKPIYQKVRIHAGDTPESLDIQVI